MIYKGQPMTLGALANQVANSTARNPWRYLYIKFPGDEGWRLAQEPREAHEVSVEELSL